MQADTTALADFRTAVQGNLHAFSTTELGLRLSTAVTETEGRPGHARSLKESVEALHKALPNASIQADTAVLENLRAALQGNLDAFATSDIGKRLSALIAGPDAGPFETSNAKDSLAALVKALPRARRTGIGAAMAGGKRGAGVGNPRQEGDWYPTPDEVTEAFLDRVPIEGDVWEPCCGDGSLARVLERRGHRVVGTDLHDRGYGAGHGPDWDVLKLDRLEADTIITNPPFNIAAQIIDRFAAMRPRTMALLLKSSFWHAKNRAALFERYPPTRILALTWRPDFLGLKRPTMEVSWCVWERDAPEGTRYELLHRPVPNAAARPNDVPPRAAG